MRNTEMFVTVLRSNIVNVEYVKLNGEQRNVRCTLISDYINDGSVKGSNNNHRSVTNVKVWDLDAEEWRTLIVDRIRTFEIEQNKAVEAATPVAPKPWGYELTIDAFNCNAYDISDEGVIRGFLQAVVDRIDMIAFGDPILQHFGSDDKKGFTAMQLIETSCITCHFSEDTNAAYINIFSCKPFNYKDVVEEVDYWFAPDSVRANFIEREADPDYTIEVGAVE